VKRTNEKHWKKMFYACAFLIVLALAGCGGGGSDGSGGGNNPPPVTTGTVSGSVKDDVTQIPLQNVKIDVSKQGVPIDCTVTGANGSYTITLPADNSYVFRFNINNYHEQTKDAIKVQANSTTTLAVLLQKFNPGISGTVKDANDNTLLSGVNVDVRKQGVSISSKVTDANGSYTIPLPNDNGYLVQFRKSLYDTVDYNNVNVQGNRMKFLETVLMLKIFVPSPPPAPQAPPGGKIHGVVVDAVKGKGVDNVLIVLRSGLNATAGDNVVPSTTTPFDSTGEFQFDNVTAGNYTAEISKPEFNTTYLNVTVLSGKTTELRATITQKLASGETRIIVTWGFLPYDLDSHLTGPLDDTGTRFHMYYIYAEGKGLGGSPWPTFVKLDLDDTDSNGPETTTIYKQITGTYRFSVHDFTNIVDQNSIALSESGAQVRVYVENNPVVTFDVPANLPGNLWTVFELNGIEITPINTISFTSAPAGIE